MRPHRSYDGVVIVAAGSGSRVGGNELKQFRWVAGKPMLLHSVQAFHRRPDVAMVVCVLPKAFVGDPPPWLFQCDIDRLLISVGGRERTESVANGLEDLPEEVIFNLGPIRFVAELIDEARVRRFASEARRVVLVILGMTLVHVGARHDDVRARSCHMRSPSSPRPRKL